MNRLALTVLAGAAALGFSSATMAADLIVPPVAPAPIYTWDGAFVGAFIGGGWGSIRDEFGTFGFIDNRLNASGWVIGVDAGYNWTTANGIVWGVVGDIEWTGNNNHRDFFFDDDGNDETPLVRHRLENRNNWAGSLRGRLGWDGGAWMPYITAGAAFANFGMRDDGFFFFRDNNDNTRWGWTAGIGVEFAATQDLSIDLLWRYNDFGRQDFDTFDRDLFPARFNFTQNTLTAGLHWRF